MGEWESGRKSNTESHHQKLFNDYDNILGKIVNMMNQPEKWSI